MPLSSIVEGRRFAERLHRFRANSIASVCIAFAAVAVATLIRWAIGDFVLGRIPFTLYFPAILLTTLVGGFWPGLLATILSALAACFFFVPYPSLLWGSSRR